MDAPEIGVPEGRGGQYNLPTNEVENEATSAWRLILIALMANLVFKAGSVALLHCRVVVTHCAHVDDVIIFSELFRISVDNRGAGLCDVLAQERPCVAFQFWRIHPACCERHDVVSMYLLNPCES